MTIQTQILLEELPRVKMDYKKSNKLFFPLHTFQAVGLEKYALMEWFGENPGKGSLQHWLIELPHEWELAYSIQEMEN